MTVRCVSCQHFSLKDAPAMAQLGFGHCDKDKPATFKSPVFERNCESHKQAPLPIEAARRKWLKGVCNV